MFNTPIFVLLFVLILIVYWIIRKPSIMSTT